MMDNQINMTTTYELNQLKSVIRAEYKEWLDIPEREVSVDLLANALIRAGYQEVHKYISEIEQLKSECEYRKKQYDNQVAENTRLQIEYDKAFERLKAQQREIDALKDENEQLNEYVDYSKKDIESLKSELDLAKAFHDEKCWKCIESKHTTAEDYAKLQEEFANYQTASDKEIERLKSENERVTDKLADVLMCIKSTTEIDVSKLVKQAKIDVLNELKEKMDNERYNDDTADIIRDIIDELIKEIEK